MLVAEEPGFQGIGLAEHKVAGNIGAGFAPPLSMAGIIEQPLIEGC